MVLVCHVILEDHVIKVLKPPLLFSLKHMAHSMSYSHIRNFTINVALTKTFTCVFSASSLILVTPFCITNNEIYAKNFCRSVQKRRQEAKREKKKAIARLFALHANAKSSYRNKQYSRYYVKVPGKFVSWASRNNKMPNYRIFSRVPTIVEIAT